VAEDQERGQGSDTESERPMSLRTKLISVGVLLLLGVVFVRFAIPPVAADRARPEGHPPGECWLCHMTTAASGAPDAP